MITFQTFLQIPSDSWVILLTDTQWTGRMALTKIDVQKKKKKLDSFIIATFYYPVQTLFQIWNL